MDSQHLSGSGGLKLAAGSCEHINEPLGSSKMWAIS
jgi:hypothetical protein